MSTTKRLVYNKTTKTFSASSDWSEIKDLVNDNLPDGWSRVTKVRGSDSDKSYKVKATGPKARGKEIEIPVGNGRSALENYERSVGYKVEDVKQENARRREEEIARLRKIEDYVSNPNSDPNAVIDLLEENNKRVGGDHHKILGSKALEGGNPEVLEWIARNGRVGDQDALYESPQCTPELLEIMATNENTYHELRGRIASSKDTPKELLTKLMKDHDSSPSVKSGLASNPNIPIEYLKDIVHSNDDRDSYFLDDIIGNPSAPTELKSEAFDRWITDASKSARRFEDLYHFIWNLTGTEEWLTDDHIKRLINLPTDHIKKPDPNRPWSNDWVALMNKVTKSLIDKYNKK